MEIVQACKCLTKMRSIFVCIIPCVCVLEMFIIVVNIKCENNRFIDFRINWAHNINIIIFVKHFYVNIT